MNKQMEEMTLALERIQEALGKIPAASWDGVAPERTAFIVVDMVNGFTREGPLKSPRVEALIPGIFALAMKCAAREIERLAFADTHSPESPEFAAYPPHCLAGTPESSLVEELASIDGFTVLAKNSTNGFLEPSFQQWLADRPVLDTFLVTGDCTDICVQQFAITLKTWFNRQNRPSRIIVPAGLVDTYDAGLHHGDLLHLVALYNMMTNGVEIVGGQFP